MRTKLNVVVANPKTDEEYTKMINNLNKIFEKRYNKKGTPCNQRTPQGLPK